MTRALALLAFAFRLRRARRLMVRGRHVEAGWVLSALNRKQWIA